MPMTTPRNPVMNVDMGDDPNGDKREKINDALAISKQSIASS